MLFEATRVGDGDAKSSGRWRMNSGSEMVLTVKSLSKKPIRAVIDFASAKFKGDKIVSLYGHDDEKVVGFWNKGIIDSAGIEADLNLVVPQNSMEAEVLPEAVAVNAMTRAGVPIQVSVGASPGPDGSWEKVKKGETITCNGREYHGAKDDSDLDLYILRGGEVFEGSICTFGADSHTGRIAAKKSHSIPSLDNPGEQEATMSDKLKKLLGDHPEKYHGLVARCVAEDMDEATISQKIRAEEDKVKDDEIKALKAQVSTLTAEKTALEEAAAATGTPEGEGEEQTPEEIAAAEEAAVEAKKTPPKKGTTIEQIEAHAAAVKAKAAGSTKGVMFAGKSGDDTTVRKSPKKDMNLSQAMAAAIEAGDKDRGFTLRAKIIRNNPNIARE